MNLKDRLIIEDYRKQRADFLALEQIVYQKLCETVKNSGIQTFAIEHRVKSEASLSEKLVRNGDWYKSFEDLTDILGARIICFFNDEVDKIGKLVEKTFAVDRRNSSDKRALIKADSFGYLSLHYTCYIPANSGYPANVCDKKFEIQIRTILQHTWAAIEHDIGYKSEFGLPREYERGFSRLAGLLEIADDEFIRMRDGINAYTADVRERIKENRADDVAINMVSLKEFVSHNERMVKLVKKISEINGAEIKETDPDNYIEQLKWFGITTIGGLQNFTAKNEDLAFKMAESTLKATDADVISSSAGLWYLCRAELVCGDYTEEKAADFLKLSVKDEDRARRGAKRLLDKYRKK